MLAKAKSALIIFIFITNQLLAQVYDYSSLKLDKPDLRFPVIKTEQLDNGIKLYYSDENSVPLFNIFILLKYPSTEQSKFTQLLQSRIAMNHDARIDSLVMLGAEYTSSPIEGGLLLSWSILSEYSDILLELIKNTFTKITIPEYTSLSSSDKKAPKRASEVADIEFDNRLFDVDSSAIKIDKMIRQDTIKIIVGITGIFNLDRAKAVLNNMRNAITYPANSEDEIIYSQKYAGIQTMVRTNSRLKTDYLRMGYLVPGIRDDNYFPLLIASEIIDHNLLYEIRMQKGLAYQINCNYLFNENIGKILISARIDPGKTEKVVENIDTLLSKISKGKIDQEDLDIARSTLEFNFLRKIANTSLLLKEIMQFEAFDLPDNYVSEYFKRIEKTTVTDVQNILKSRLSPDNLVTVILSSVNSNK